MNLYNGYKTSLQLVREKGTDYPAPFEIKNSASVFQLLKERIKYLNREMIIAVLMNTASHVIGVYEVATGTQDSCITDGKEIFKSALLANANRIIVVHNHVTDNCIPSIQDKLLTEKLRKAGKILTIDIIDHLIISPDSYYSFADHNEPCLQG